jgi:hypothetical protein
VPRPTCAGIWCFSERTKSLEVPYKFEYTSKHKAHWHQGWDRHFLWLGQKLGQAPEMGQGLVLELAQELVLELAQELAQELLGLVLVACTELNWTMVHRYLCG